MFKSTSTSVADFVVTLTKRPLTELTEITNILKDDHPTLTRLEMHTKTSI